MPQQEHIIALVIGALWAIAGFMAWYYSPEQVNQRAINDLGVYSLSIQATAPTINATYADRFSEKLNFVIIVTDDQRYDTLQYMPAIQEDLIMKGVNFNNTFASTPLCCPTRASFLAGGMYPFRTGVLTNALPLGGATRFNDLDTIATALQENGYKTGLVGKYMNDYYLIRDRIPPGWTSFQATTSTTNFNGVYSFAVGSSSPHSPGNATLETDSPNYLTYEERDKAIGFIEENSHSPFFLYLGFDAPHNPANPAHEDEGAFANYTFSSPGTTETDLSDKPSWMQEQQLEPTQGNSSSSGDSEGEDQEISPAQRLRTLLAVDRSVSDIVQKIEDEGIMDKTVIVYTSDNGLMYGEHGGLEGKKQPYEESIRVPLVVRMPQVEPRGDQHLVAWNLDIPATIFSLTGIGHKSDGLTLFPLMIGEKDAQWRQYLVLQSYGIGTVDSWVGLRTQDLMFFRLKNGDIQLYDMVHDPYQLESVHNNAAYRDKIREFSELIKPFQGFSVITTHIPNAIFEMPYSFTLRASGGIEPYHWSLINGTMPSGLTLSSDGVISGEPKASEGYGQKFSIQATDSSTNTQSGKPQYYIFEQEIILGLPATQ